VLSGDMYQGPPLNTIPFWPTFYVSGLWWGLSEYVFTGKGMVGWEVGGGNDWVRGWDEWGGIENRADCKK
jgi:hypothetical protein